MDTDFLVDYIFRGQAPKLELELSFVDTKRFTAVTKFPEGEQCWLSDEPVFERLRATTTMPGPSKFGVTIGGVVYADGCLSTSLEDCVDKAFVEGAKKVVVIDNSVHGPVSAVSKAFLRFASRKAPDCMKRAVERFCSIETKPLQSSERVFVCRAENLPSQHGLTRPAHLSRASIEQGYADAGRLNLT